MGDKNQAYEKKSTKKKKEEGTHKVLDYFIQNKMCTLLTVPLVEKTIRNNYCFHAERKANKPTNP